ncbi:hypothetical protein ADM96_32935 [Burkholderia sp. ST111]|nr:hypothetical protein ADM96_32935 [Burkholderia sp. ST111]
MHEIGRDDVVLQFSTLSFDASIEQLWPALAVGAAVAMRGDASWDPEILEAYLRDECVTLADLRRHTGVSGRRRWRVERTLTALRCCARSRWAVRRCRRICWDAGRAGRSDTCVS